MAKIKISCETEAEIIDCIQLLSAKAQVKTKGNIGKSKDGKYFNIHLDVRKIQKTT